MAKGWDSSTFEYEMAAKLFMGNEVATMSCLSPPSRQEVPFQVAERMRAVPTQWDSQELRYDFAQFRKELPIRRPPRAPFKVSERVRAVGPTTTNLYTADIISLGFHKTRFGRGMQYKAACYRSFIKWSTPHHKASSKSSTDSALEPIWEQFVEGLDLDKDLPTVERCYTMDLSDGGWSTIVKTLLALDALFLVMFLMYCYNNCPKCPKLPDGIYKELHESFYMLQAEEPGGIWGNIFQLENQVPLGVLCKVWSSMPGSELSSKKPLEPFNDLLTEVMKDQYLKQLIGASSSDGREKLSKIVSHKKFTDGEHLLDCLHYVICCSPEEQQKLDSVVHVKSNDKVAALFPADTIPSATELRKAGIRITSEGCYFLHQIRFEDSLLAPHALILPRLRISDRNESLSIFRNLAEFEALSHNRDQVNPRIGLRMWNLNHYLKLMTKLVQSREDVKLMKNNEVIVVGHGSNFDVYQLWNLVGKRLSCHPDEEWSKRLLKLSDRYKAKRYRLFADIRRKSCGKWWTTISWVAGALLIVLTGLQTAFTMLSYYKSTCRYCNGN